MTLIPLGPALQDQRQRALHTAMVKTEAMDRQAIFDALYEIHWRLQHIIAKCEEGRGSFDEKEIQRLREAVNSIEAFPMEKEDEPIAEQTDAFDYYE